MSVVRAAVPISLMALLTVLFILGCSGDEDGEAGARPTPIVPAPIAPGQGPNPVDAASTAEALAASIEASEAVEHLGQRRTVCGTVTAARREERAVGSTGLMFLDFGPPHPDQEFTVHFNAGIARHGDWPDEVDRSIDIAEWFTGRRICVTSLIERFRGGPAMNANFWYQYYIPE